MKRLVKILLSIFLIVPSVLGMCFISPNLASESVLTTSNGGGGANSLDSPKIGESSDFDDSVNDAKNNLTKSSDYVVEIKDNSCYFTDYTLPESIEGNGTENKPYQVYSLEDFLFLTKLNLKDKFIELNCDIILNDEFFDENGTPSGGDGIVYQWEPLKNFTETVYLRFLGNGHTIKGLYINDETKTNLSLFGNTTLSKIENLKFENVYIYGNKCCYSIATACNYIYNVDIISGKIGSIAPYYYDCAGYVDKFYKMKDCDNYAIIYGYAGMANKNLDNALVENCNFYGKLTGFSWMGGFVARNQSSLTIRNCNNYADITGKSVYVGGFVGISYYGKCHLLIENSNNYGNVYSENVNIGGFCGFVEGYVDLINCSNFGNIDSSSYRVGQFIGLITHDYTSLDTMVNIVNSTAVSKSQISFIGTCQKANVNMSNISIDFDLLTNNKKMGIIMSSDSDNSIINLDNIYITGAGQNYLFNSITTIKKLTMKNIFVDMMFAAEIKIAPQIKVKLIDIDGVILKSDVLRYYGTDFSDFYVDWKSGKFRLKYTSGKGFFQSEVTEEYLLEKGYEKIEF